MCTKFVARRVFADERVFVIDDGDGREVVRVSMVADADGRDVWTAHLRPPTGAALANGEGATAIDAFVDARQLYEALGDDLRAYVRVPWRDVERALRRAGAFA